MIHPLNPNIECSLTENVWLDDRLHHSTVKAHYSTFSKQFQSMRFAYSTRSFFYFHIFCFRSISMSYKKKRMNHCCIVVAYAHWCHCTIAFFLLFILFSDFYNQPEIKSLYSIDWAIYFRIVVGKTGHTYFIRLIFNTQRVCAHWLT